MEPGPRRAAARAFPRARIDGRGGHLIAFRHADARFSFLWETAEQPGGRWHGEGEGPAHYFADTPDGAWAELLRHEGIRAPEDLRTLRRALWAVEIADPPEATPRLPLPVLTGGTDTYEACREQARRLRTSGAVGLRAPSAAMRPGEARGFQVRAGLRDGPDRDGVVFVLFGPRPDLVGWAAASEGRPREDLLDRVRHL